MSILVILRKENGERLEGAPTVPFQKIVSWDHRHEYPMLGFVDPMGFTVFNRLQVKALVLELESIRDLIAEKGPFVAATILGADQAEESLRIVGWDLERDLASLVEQLLQICSVSLERYHRYLWFLGD